MGNVLGILLGLTFLAAWANHVITCLSNGDWGFLVAGALFFPIGIIHGFGLWMGFF